MAAVRRKHAEELTVVAPDRRKHADALCDLVGKVFSGGGYYKMRDRARNGYILKSHYDWTASRIGFVGDRMVAHYGVWDVTMRIGTAAVRVGGIGAVSTDADYRKRGLMARTARVSVRAMCECGYDLSLLFGISDFYHRFGYVRAWSDGHYTVAVEHLPADPPAVRLRKFTPTPRDDLARLYNRDHARLTGTAVKPTFPHLMWPHPQQGYRWTDARGRLRGYVIFNVRDGRLHCCEACGDVEQVLRAVAKLARRFGCQEVRFEAFHERSPLIRRLRWGTCHAETRHLRCGGAMVATINLAQTLVKMAPELSGRLRASLLAGWRGRLVVADRRETVTLAIDRSRVKVAAEGRSRHAIRGDDRIAQLLIGTDEPADVIQAARIKTTGDAAALAGVLFPNEHPMLGVRDRF